MADHRAPGARTSAIARTRLLDDIVSEALREGLPQVAILGAAFACRIYRHSGTSSVTAFEVDHPATVAAKRSRLRMLIERLPPNVPFVEIDFSRQSLAEVLDPAGSIPAGRRCSSGKVLQNYLTADAVDAVLRYWAYGSRVIRIHERIRFLSCSRGERAVNAAGMLSRREPIAWRPASVPYSNCFRNCANCCFSSATSFWSRVISSSSCLTRSPSTERSKVCALTISSGSACATSPDKRWA